MKYTITINQAAVVDAGLHEKIDIIDLAILDYLKDWLGTERNIKIKEIDNLPYIWVNYKHLLANMPLLQLKSKGSISKRLKKLSDANLLNLHFDKDNQKIYFRITDYCISTCFFCNKTVHQNERYRSPKRTVPFTKMNGTVHQNEQHPLIYQDNNTSDNISFVATEAAKEGFRLAKILLEEILKNQNSVRLKNLPENKQNEICSKWAVDIDRLIRVDRQNPSIVEEVIRWCQQDDFWGPNILSGRKLREKWDTLVARKNRVSIPKQAMSKTQPKTQPKEVEDDIGMDRIKKLKEEIKRYEQLGGSLAGLKGESCEF